MDPDQQGDSTPQDTIIPIITSFTSFDSVPERGLIVDPGRARWKIFAYRAMYVGMKTATL
jgi:hypothetical protein